MEWQYENKEVKPYSSFENYSILDKKIIKKVKKNTGYFVNIL
jgi:hypothetical protein